MDFLNDLGKKFNQAAKNLTGWGRDEHAPSDRMAEALRLGEAELDVAYARLGRVCYEKMTGKRESVPEDAVTAVREALEKLSRLSADSASEAARRKCPFCGSIQEEHARYCSSCGKPLQDEAAQAYLETRDSVEYCLECGAAREDGATCCAVCGKPFEAPKEEETPQTFEPFQPVEDAPEEPEDEERYQDD
ncbi:MAG: zinc ribbon domain-containing protein [Clostridia bacterium]|nr:zinc ribbon domain-containing protein [Clostridia bacterium]